jgi:hypothetical protein
MAPEAKSKSKLLVSDQPLGARVFCSTRNAFCQGSSKYAAIGCCRRCSHYVQQLLWVLLHLEPVVGFTTDRTCSGSCLGAVANCSAALASGQ